TLVNILVAMHPEMRDQIDLKHKFWDHLFIMSDFTLDVESPYPLPQRPQDAPRPKKTGYTQEEFKLRPYGKYIERMIQEAVKMDDGPEKDALVMNIANNLKKMYLNWNRDSVNDELIHNHLALLSRGLLRLKEDDKLHSTTEILKTSSINGQPSNSGDTMGKKKKFIPKKDMKGRRRNFGK
ncbi:MAG TPA: DUF4290 domain-containing protein, partial [Bacteroidales bacterium]|nr:DUF4290 domain-containing protein [Bacteroidales bacterium]